VAIVSRRTSFEFFAVLLAAVFSSRDAAIARQDVRIDLSAYSPACGVSVRTAGDTMRVTWPIGGQADFGHMVLNLRSDRPLIASLQISGEFTGAESILTGVDPVTFVTVGTRNAPDGRPPTMSVWNVFFDTPAKLPYQSYASKLDLESVRVTSAGRRASIAVGNLTLGPFSGEFVFTFYAGCRLIHVEAVVSTPEDRRAIIYDAGLVGENAGWRQVAWVDTEGTVQRFDVDPQANDRAIAARHRAIIASNEVGSVATFPPPHQFQFPRDLTTNLNFVWSGRGHQGTGLPFGIGVRQSPDGGGNWVPWFNAPPDTKQRLGVFYLLTRGGPEHAIRETLRYTRGDRFAAIPGHITFTSHWHMAIAVAAMQQRAAGQSDLPIPDFVRMFKQMGVQAVHLAEFHGDGHPDDPGPLRLPELESMFAECERLSDAEVLFIPGEEANSHLGLNEPGKHRGHWMSIFPKPIYWTMRREPNEPFDEPHARYGTLYRVGSRQDMMELIRCEHGLAWVAHPRIKASSWTPDIFRHEDFYLADYWLGAAWKAMPADLSRDRLGERCLDLLSDMANWGQKKYMPGEADVFKIDHTHELFGHMNINYLRLDRLPRYGEGWEPILDALRAGRFFVTTGEVLIRDFRVGGKQSGESLAVGPDDRPELIATLDWTFPLRFAEVISGDGERTYRERIELVDTGPFAERTLTLRPNLQGRKWVRFEVWDIATNGAFTQPVWLEPGK
jgi:hypothetical protein